jgi:hypothetical protein
VPQERWKFARQELADLIVANKIQLLVAEKCLQIAEYATIVFEQGYQPVRGDSATAIYSALGAVASAISIVYLNLCERLDCGWKIVSIESGWHLGGNFAFKEAGDVCEFFAAGY